MIFNPSLCRLGFGTSGLMARLNRKQSLRLLAAAYDSGITHFDTAPLYGYGAAEGVLGEFIAERRTGVTVATKVGILPPSRSRLLDAAKYAARGVVRLCPSLRASFRRRAESLTRAGVFDVPIMQQSLDNSLRELRTSYVDMLLLHECQMADVMRQDVLEFLEQNRAAGKLRFYGVATTAEVCSVVKSYPVAQVVQFPSNAVTRAVQSIAPSGSGLAAVTHSSLGPPFSEIFKRLADDDNMAQAWSRSLRIDVRDRRALAAVFLTYAINANLSGCVLFSSSSEANIRRNALTASGAGANAAQVDALLDCLALARDVGISCPIVSIGGSAE